MILIHSDVLPGSYSHIVDNGYKVRNENNDSKTKAGTSTDVVGSVLREV